MLYFSSILVASLACLANASLLITKPLASTTCSATLPCTVSWKDSGTSPSLAQIGPVTIDLCRGSASTPTCEQRIASAVDLSKNSSVVYNPSYGIGPTGDYYILKFSAIGSTKFTAYSTKFTLVGMGGTYDQAIDGSQVVIVPTTMSGSGTAATVHIAGATAVASASASATPISSTSGAVPFAAPRVFASAMGVTLILGMGSVYLGMLLLGF